MTHMHLELQPTHLMVVDLRVAPGVALVIKDQRERVRESEFPQLRTGDQNPAQTPPPRGCRACAQGGLSRHEAITGAG